MVTQQALTRKIWIVRRTNNFNKVNSISIAIILLKIFTHKIWTWLSVKCARERKSIFTISRYSDCLITVKFGVNTLSMASYVTHIKMWGIEICSYSYGRIKNHPQSCNMLSKYFKNLRLANCTFSRTGWFGWTTRPLSFSGKSRESQSLNRHTFLQNGSFSSWSCVYQRWHRNLNNELIVLRKRTVFRKEL